MLLAKLWRIGFTNREFEDVFVSVITKVVEALLRRCPLAVRRYALHKMLLSIEAHNPLSVDQPLLVRVHRWRRDSELGVVVLSLASGHSIATHKLDVTPSDSERDRHILVVELRDAFVSIAAFIIELLRACARLTALSAVIARGARAGRLA